ncbi:MAG: hypothetical protein ABR606_04850 [Vicinamibacterales bacterium]
MATVILLTARLSAQAPNAVSARLGKVTSLKCTFSALATGTWTKGETEAAIKAATLAVSFRAVDAQDGTAEAVGDFGKSHITVRLLGSYLHLMQMDPYGALYVTTVFDTETREGKLQAVHTRHEYTAVSLPGLTSRPEQYYGECEGAPK